MADRPIAFSGEMVAAILDRRKTQTRRVLKPQPPSWCFKDRQPGYSMFTLPGHISFRGVYVDENGVDHGPAEKFIKMPYIPGDRLWVREAWKAWAEFDDRPPSQIPRSAQVQYLADMPLSEWDSRYRHARFMPRWASRITLLVTDVRVQRLQEISEADAKWEGLAAVSKDDGKTVKYGIPDRDGLPGNDDHGWSWQEWCVSPQEAYRKLWDSLHEKSGHTWDANPWVAAITFKPIFQNIDKVSE